MQITLIDHILERANVDGKRFKDTDEIVEAFVYSIFGDATQRESPVTLSLTYAIVIDRRRI